MACWRLWSRKEWQDRLWAATAPWSSHSCWWRTFTWGHKVPAQPPAWTQLWVRWLRSDLVLLQQLDLDAQVLADLLVALLLVLEVPLGPLQPGQRASVPRPQVQLLQVHPVGVVLHPAGDGLEPG